MMIRVLKSKLHRATVTGAHLHYHGSLTIDRDLMDAVGLVPYEAITVANVNTGDRLETYALPGPRGRRQIEINGAAARLGQVGDRLIVFSFAWVDPKELAGHAPRVALLDEQNRLSELIARDTDPSSSREPTIES